MVRMRGVCCDERCVVYLEGERDACMYLPYTLCILIPHEYKAYVCIYVRMYVVQRVRVISSSTVQLTELSMGWITISLPKQ